MITVKEELLQIGQLVGGKYKILNEIGRGGMSVVYLAINEKLNTTWAIKVAKRNGLHDNNTAIQNLTADKKMLINLSHHNLPRIVDVYDTEDTMMIVMDYISGKSLKETLDEYGVQREEEVVKWGIQLCDVLGYLHSKGIIYRDLKPDNIMMKPNGNIALIDFGTAKEYYDDKSRDTVPLGTKGYAAPEQSIKATVLSDIYNLGATLRHLVTGIDPKDPSNVDVTLNPIRQINVALSEGLEHIITKCLMPTPSERYQSAEELGFDLENYKIIGEDFKRKQRSKLVKFLIPVVLTFAFTAASIYCYVGAQRNIEENYDAKVTAATATGDEFESAKLLKEAIALDSSRTVAYLNLIELFINDDILTRDESSTLIRLKSGIDIEGKNGNQTIKPLLDLKSNESGSYQKICYEIGMAHWYYYDAESDKYIAAMEWFSDAISDKYPDAQYYVDIGQCHKAIKKYRGQERNDKVYEEYATLWESLVNLKNSSDDLDNYTKLLIWREIVSTINDNTIYFNRKITAETMLALLNEISDDATEFKKSPNIIPEEESDVNILLEKISDAKKRINTITQQEVDE